MNYYQNGDCLLFVETENPTKAKVVKGNLLHKGQNHHHRIRGKFKLLDKGGVKFVVSSGCELFHEEHKPLKLPKGVYRLAFVVEYDHFENESRQVVD